MQRKIKKFAAITTLALLILESSFVLISPAYAKADDLIIEDNGSITLLITNGNAVLAAETSKNQKAAPPAPAPATTKVVVPPKTESTVKIDPKPSSDNKVKITVQTPAALTNTVNITKASPAPNANPQPVGQNQPQGNSAPNASPTPTTVTGPQTVVDKVVLNGPDQKPVITISGDNSKDLNIKSGSTSISTSLPVQVNSNVAPDGTVSHDVSVTTSAGPVKLSVLPDIAVKAAESEVSNSNLQPAKTDVTLTTVNTGLVGSKQDPTYTVSEEKKGKILGLIPVSLNSQVQISATSGRTVSSWQSPLSIFGFLVK